MYKKCSPTKVVGERFFLLYNIGKEGIISELGSGLPVPLSEELLEPKRGFGAYGTAIKLSDTPSP